MDGTCVYMDQEIYKKMKKVFHKSVRPFSFCEIFCNVSHTYIVIYVKEDKTGRERRNKC